MLRQVFWVLDKLLVTSLFPSGFRNAHVSVGLLETQSDLQVHSPQGIFESQ